MRQFLLATATLCALGVVTFAQTAQAEETHPKAEMAKEAAKPVNHIDPLTGKEVDAKVATLELTHEKKPVIVGFSSAESLAKATAADEKTKAMIADAAVGKKLIKDGALVDLPKEPEHKKKHKDADKQ